MGSCGRAARPAPWCGTPFTPKSFSLAPNAQAPQTMERRCDGDACPFTGDRCLPVVAVDDAIYRRLPAFLIATVDKSRAGEQVVTSPGGGGRHRNDRRVGLGSRGR